MLLLRDADEPVAGGARQRTKSAPWAWALTALTIGWNSLEAMIAIASGVIAAADLGSVALRADAAQTNLCTYLSVVVLIGLAANALAGWWWMDPIAGLAVAALAIREGIEAWRSGDLCAC